MLGTINKGRVYAAYSYEAVESDECSFEAGDEMRVLQRDEERGWWKVVHEGTGKEGLVPRNYLAVSFICLSGFGVEVRVASADFGGGELARLVFCS